jgi:hypothetical protein
MRVQLNETRFDPKKSRPRYTFVSQPKKSRHYFDALDEHEIGI